MCFFVTINFWEVEAVPEPYQEFEQHREKTTGPTGPTDPRTLASPGARDSGERPGDLSPRFLALESYQQSYVHPVTLDVNLLSGFW